ncbi:MAG: hypothetical protein HNEKOMLI_00530 [Sodalis sp. Psp]|nr:hypothetical protein [Sodalis sp. Psp]MCR3757002.1 hypothetical protein [Sodalis sp. Ppy]
MFYAVVKQAAVAVKHLRGKMVTISSLLVNQFRVRLHQARVKVTASPYSGREALL